MAGGPLDIDPVALGPYRLLSRLGGGGMGQVYLGMSPGGRRVAVKVIKSEFAADPEFRRRFAREVAASRSIIGMFAAPVIDADTDGPVLWVATPYIPGPSLDAAVRESGPLPLASLLPLGAGLAKALAAIHDAGLVHRDLKPSNVLLAADGPRITDFGIWHAAKASPLTQPDGVMGGSPGYMSPEQARGLPVGPASDVFSLGAVLAFAATGTGPFGSGSVAALVHRALNEAPALDRVPPELRPLIERCLAKAPQYRPTPSYLLSELGGELIPENWLPETIADTLPRYEPSARIAALAPGKPPPTAAAAPETPAPETLAPKEGEGGKAPATPADEMPAPEALAPQTRAGARIAFAEGAAPPTVQRSLPDKAANPRSAQWAAEHAALDNPYDAPRCLVIAPSYADLSALGTVLAELGITFEATTQLLVGAQLATVPLDDYSFAVAVLPASSPDGTMATTPATIFLEAGIALGRGVPLIVLAEDPDEDLPVLSGLASNVWTIVGAKDEASIRLHLTLFTKVLETRTPARDSIPRLEPSTASSVTPSTETIGRRHQSLQEEVLGLLQAGGAKVESEAGADGGRDCVDAAALIPGTERVLGPVLIDVKALQGHGLSAAVSQLATFLAQSGATFGLVVYDGPHQKPGPPSGFPIVAMHIEELREHVRLGSLGWTLVYARNAAAHGLPR